MAFGTSVGEYGSQYAPEREELRQLDAAERVGWLPYARAVALAPGPPGDEEPTYVFIVWALGVVERPCPGSALWRAVLERFLRKEHSRARSELPDEAADPVGLAVAADLRRFPSLDAWFAWRDRDRTVPNRRP